MRVGALQGRHEGRLRLHIQGHRLLRDVRVVRRVAGEGAGGGADCTARGGARRVRLDPEDSAAGQRALLALAARVGRDVQSPRVAGHRGRLRQDRAGGHPAICQVQRHRVAYQRRRRPRAGERLRHHRVRHPADRT